MLHHLLRNRKPWSFFGSISAVSAIILAALTSPLPAEDVDAYFIGNSLTGNIQRESLSDLVNTHTAHTLDTGMTGAAGAPLDYLWKNDERRDHMLAAFSQGGWDFVSLQPFLRNVQKDVPPALEMLNAALVDSPDAQFLIYAQWPSNQGFDYSRLWLQDVTNPNLQQPSRTGGYYEGLTKELRQQQPAGTKPFNMVPAGHAMFILDQKIKAGIVTELTGFPDWMSDGTHANNVGGFITAMTFYGVFYGESPVGLPPGAYQGNGASTREMSSQLIEQLQQIAWEAVTGTELSGVQGTEPVEVVSPGIFINGVQDEPYRMQLVAGYGPTPYTWSVAGGTLPRGLALGSDGWITGTPLNTGDFTFTAEVTDANAATDTREFTITVEPDIGIEVVELESTPTYRAGEDINLPLLVTGGNGEPIWTLNDARWALASNDFPPGSFWVAPSGALLGTIGKPGTYRFKLDVKDGDLGSPEKDQLEVMINILPPNRKVLFTDRMVEVPDLANPNDALWNLQPLPLQMVEGTGEMAVQYQLGWGPGFSGSIFGIFVVEDNQVVTDSTDLRQDDTVEILLDGANNREMEFNADDRNIVIRADGETDGVFDPDFRYHTETASLTPDGYTVGFKNNGNNLPSGLFKNPYNTFGFDFQVYDDDDGGDRERSAVFKVGRTEGENQQNWGTVITRSVAIIRPQNVGAMWAGKELEFQCEAAFGTPPYTWSHENLADGLSVSPDGVLSGIPTGDGPEFLWLIVTDAEGLSHRLTWSYFPMHSNPDSDNDGLPDAWELLYYPDLSKIDAESDLDKDRISAKAELVLDFDPTQPNSWELESELLEDESGRWMVARWRRNTAFPMASTNLLWRSDDLQNWTPVTLDGFNAVQLIVDPDVDGDGSAELVEARVRVPEGQQQIFLKMEPQILYLDERP